RLGFRPEGKIREAEWLYDHFVDHLVYGMLAPDWFEREVRYQASSPGATP
ncbi:MAG: GNAT family N-acetyltransferase, partial [Ignavibacteriales bacterium]|nr:GNAT family N-acetyltransferase [Ignavibacteriales bacterium]